MRKLVFSLAASMAVATPALAAADAGPYVGAGVTYDSINGTQAAEGLGIAGVGGTVFAGYNLPVNGKVFGGIEANFNLASADVGDKTNGVKADNAFGASVRLGYDLSNTAAFYGRVGYQRGRASVYSGGTKTSGSRDGLLLGAGLEANLTQKVGVRVEFDHVNYYRDKAVDPANIGLADNQATVAVVYGF